ncbi:MAG: Crp/Fnr family transcriptional regulator [Rhizobiales bacterium]|nr:Crp/Fnr family transcriptional regulator [Hyphomicrobiales bacterium]MBO6700509.1 Crp/Fnr family transcriptional regulator [Hyphomicrobiales bacterium]MBO6738045.1 Crp/Fnr family transcriptional regulator [Hyphomicrobiales bacterium]MBO6913648.1 Crp/Fnr family transcriptional regulator [Hyphomicrobiales bacterium]MBO6954455.1 Crp/Fnr family transcriptional regulator [Hyphomicrobiales bacterium]
MTQVLVAECRSRRQVMQGANIFTESLALAGLDPDLATGLSNLAREAALSTNEVLFVAGDPGDSMYAILEGSLKVAVISAEGSEQLLAILGPGHVVGEMALLDGEPRSATVQAIKKSRVARIDKADFDRFADANPAVYRHMLALVSQRLRQANDVLAARSFLPLPGRVAVALLQLGETFGKELPDDRLLVHYKVSQADLAGMVGAARENVSRILNTWKRDGLISRISGYYCIEKPSELERLKAM